MSENSKMTRKEKRRCRVAALQAVYAQELNGSDMNTTLSFLFEENDNPNVIKYASILARLTLKNSEKMDSYIVNRSKNWDINRITLMDKLILRLSLTEMLLVNEIPPKVSIAEGVEIAKDFSTKDSSSFVNGILDSVYNDYMKGKILLEELNGDIN
jgi:N utilization substance protein B